MHMKKKIPSMLLLTMLLLSIIMINPAVAQSPTSVSVVNPSTGESSFIHYTNVTSVGYRFNATAWVYNVTDLFAYQVYLTYNATLLNATRAWRPVWDSQWVFNGRDTFWGTFDPAAGAILGVGYVQLGDAIMSGGGATFNGTGILAVIEFEILTAPPELGTVFSDLEIDNADTYLLDSDLVEIPTSKIGGLYTFVWLEPGLEVRQLKDTFATLETFNITVWLNNVTDSDRLVRLEFKLRYNATLLNVTGVTEGPFLAGFGTGSTTFNYADDKVENLTITNYLNPPYDTNFPEGNGIIATIFLQGIYQDNVTDLNSPLALIDIQFQDDSGNPITPITSPINGSYTILRDRGSYIEIVTPSSATIGSNVTISGRIARAWNTSVDVTIYFRNGSQPWVNLTTVQTDSSSSYTYTLNTSILGLGEFELKANWTGDASNDPAQSQPIKLTVNKLASEITINVNPVIVTVGETVTINGAVNITRANIKVTIYYKRGETEKSLANVTTDSGGNYLYIWVTTLEGSYELYSSWPGDNVTDQAVSPTPNPSLTVRKKPSTITISVAPENVTIGSNVTISGSISPAKSNVDVTLYYRPADGNWSLLRYVKTKSDSSFSYVWKPPRNVTYELYAFWSGDANTQSDSSDLVTLRVLMPSEITIIVDQSTVTAELNITISGTIRPKKIGVNVAINYRLNVSGAEWISLTTVPTDSSGNYTFTWKSTKTTNEPSDTFELRAEWNGDQVTSGAKSNITTVIVEKTQSIITIALSSSKTTVQSNVTISGFITPTRANVTVTIYYREKETPIAFALASITNPEGHYNHTWKPTKIAIFELYAVWDGDQNTYWNKSQIATLEVNLAKSSITLDADPKSTTVGSNITLTGAIIPKKTSVEVSIYYRLEMVNQSWTELGKTTTDSNGNYTFTWTTTEPGTFELEARWPGDDLTESSKSQTETVKIEESSGLVAYTPYILGGAALVIIALLVIYMTKIRKS